MPKVLVVLAVTLLTTSSAMAAALGPHATNASNPCKTCHDTASGTPALRGWSGSGAGPGGAGWGTHPLSNLCYMCHQAGGAGTGAHNMEPNAYDNGNHGPVAADIPAYPNGTGQSGMATSGLPYVAATAMECTTCHNVHVETVRPFNQRSSFSALCNNCHIGRENSSASRTYNAASGRTYSTHPTGRPLGDPVGKSANIKDEGAIASNLRVALAAAPNYSLGGHLSAGATGNLDCQTCHAVHGPTLGAAIAYNDLLAIDNTTGAGGSALCTGCHFGGVAGEQVGTYTTVPAEDSDHPIDNRGGRPFYPTGAVAIPNLWLLGNENSDRGAQPFFGGLTPTCSTCHDAHGGIVGTPILRGPTTGPGDYTFAYDTWCFLCHPNYMGIPYNHHSVVNNMPTSQLSCGDCHGSGTQINEWRAHNGFWGFPLSVSSTNSAICESCHLYNDPTTNVTPGPKGQVIAPFNLPSRHGTIRGSGPGSSHQTSSSSVAVALTPTPNITNTPVWPTYGGPARGSQYASGNQPICESCHNLLTNGTATQGLANGWQGNLLLAPYEDDLPGVGAGEGANDRYGNTTYGAGPTGDAFCRACHNSPTVPGFVHNPSAHTQAGYLYPADVSPYGRTTLSVMTTPFDSTNAANCPESSTADASGSPNTLSYPAANSVNCDSCHRPHNADVDSYDAGASRFLILESTDANWGTTICAQCHNTDVQCSD